MEEEIGEEDTRSVDSVNITEVKEMVITDSKLHYLCRTSDNTEEIYDRSDLMDGGEQQSLVLQFERRHPPPWDKVCFYCEGEGCEECICDMCNRKCRHLEGVNYGCVQHPVV